MKIKKKPLFFLLAALLTINVIATSALAVEAPNNPVNDEIITPQSEQTEWVYRNNNGVIQKRLWSNTYGVWLTDWMNA